MAVVTNASVAPCAPQKTCLSIAVTIRSRLSDPVPLSDLTASERLNESESVTIGRRAREFGTEGPISAGTDRSHCAPSTASDTEYASAARVHQSARLIVLLVQYTKCPSCNSPSQKRQGSCVRNSTTLHWLFDLPCWPKRHLHTSLTEPWTHRSLLVDTSR